MKSIIKSVLAATVALAFAGGSALAADAVNEKCPVKGKEVDGSKVVDYTATFCCEKCVAKFKKDPLAYAEKVAGAEDGKCAFSGKATDAAQTVKVNIGVCCGGCQKKVKADPEKFLAKLQKAS